MNFSLLLLLLAVGVYFWAFNNIFKVIQSLQIPEEAEKQFIEQPAEMIDMLKDGLEYRRNLLKTYISIINFSAAMFYVPIILVIGFILLGGSDAPPK